VLFDKAEGEIATEENMYAVKDTVFSHRIFVAVPKVHLIFSDFDRNMQLQRRQYLVQMEQMKVK